MMGGSDRKNRTGSHHLGRPRADVGEHPNRNGKRPECDPPIQHTENLRGARWSKLILNSMVSALGTLHGTRLGPVVALRVARRLALQIITEGVRVAQAAEVHLEKVSGTLDLDKLCLTP